MMLERLGPNYEVDVYGMFDDMLYSPFVTSAFRPSFRDLQPTVVYMEFTAMA